MPFIEAKCPNCGGNLPVDSAREAWICGYCGTPFVVEKAIQSLNVNVTVQPADFEIRGGVLVKYRGAGVDAIIPEGVVEIGAEAFKDCAGLQSVRFPEGLEKVCEGAFEDCDRLQTVILPKQLPEHVKCYANAYASR